MSKTKIYLKEISIKIRTYKSKRKLKNRGNLNLWELESEIRKEKYHYRHHHIALCETKGRTREQIERPAKNNLPNQKYIDQIKEKIIEEFNEQTIRLVA